MKNTSNLKEQELLERETLQIQQQELMDELLREGLYDPEAIKNMFRGANSGSRRKKYEANIKEESKKNNENEQVISTKAVTIHVEKTQPKRRGKMEITEKETIVKEEKKQKTSTPRHDDTEDLEIQSFIDAEQRISNVVDEVDLLKKHIGQEIQKTAVQNIEILNDLILNLHPETPEHPNVMQLNNTKNALDNDSQVLKKSMSISVVEKRTIASKKKEERDMIKKIDEEFTKVFLANHPEVIPFAALMIINPKTLTPFRPAESLNFIKNNIALFQNIKDVNVIGSTPTVLLKDVKSQSYHEVDLKTLSQLSSEQALYIISGDIEQALKIASVVKGDKISWVSEQTEKMVEEKKKYNTGNSKVIRNLTQNPETLSNLCDTTFSANGTSLTTLSNELQKECGLDKIGYINTTDYVFMIYDEDDKIIKVDESLYNSPTMYISLDVDPKTVATAFNNRFQYGKQDTEFFQSVILNANDILLESISDVVRTHELNNGTVESCFRRVADLYQVSLQSQRQTKNPDVIRAVGEKFPWYASRPTSSRTYLFCDTDNLEISPLFSDAMIHLRYTWTSKKIRRLPKSMLELFTNQVVSADGTLQSIMVVNPKSKGSQFSTNKRDKTFIAEYIQHERLMETGFEFIEHHNLHNDDKRKIKNSIDAIFSKVVVDDQDADFVNLCKAGYETIGLKTKFEVRKKDKNVRLYNPTSIYSMMFFQYIINSFSSKIPNLVNHNPHNLMGIVSSGSESTLFLNSYLNDDTTSKVSHYSDNVYIASNGWYLSCDVVKMDANHDSHTMFSTMQHIGESVLEGKLLTLWTILNYLNHIYYEKTNALISFDSKNTIKVPELILPSGTAGTFIINHGATGLITYVANTRFKNNLIDTIDGVPYFTEDFKSFLDSTGFELKIETSIKISDLKELPLLSVVKSDFLGYDAVKIADNRFMPVFEYKRVLKAMAFNKSRSENPIVRMFVSLSKSLSMWECGGWFYNDLSTVLYNHIIRLGTTLNTSLRSMTQIMFQSLVDELADEKIEINSFSSLVTNFIPKSPIDLIKKYIGEDIPAAIYQHVPQSLRVDILQMIKQFPDSLINNLMVSLSKKMDSTTNYTEMIRESKNNLKIIELTRQLPDEAPFQILKETTRIEGDTEIFSIPDILKSSLGSIASFIRNKFKEDKTYKDRSMVSQLSYLLAGIFKVAGEEGNILAVRATSILNKNYLNPKSELNVLYKSIIRKDSEERAGFKKDLNKFLVERDNITGDFNVLIPYHQTILKHSEMHKEIIDIIIVIMLKELLPPLEVVTIDGALESTNMSPGLMVKYMILNTVLVKYPRSSFKKWIEGLNILFKMSLQKNKKIQVEFVKNPAAFATRFRGIKTEEVTKLEPFLPADTYEYVAQIYDPAIPLSLKKKNLKMIGYITDELRTTIMKAYEELAVEEVNPEMLKIYYDAGQLIDPDNTFIFYTIYSNLPTPIPEEHVKFVLLCLSRLDNLSEFFGYILMNTLNSDMPLFKKILPIIRNLYNIGLTNYEKTQREVLSDFLIENVLGRLVTKKAVSLQEDVLAKIIEENYAIPGDRVQKYSRVIENSTIQKPRYSATPALNIDLRDALNIGIEFKKVKKVSKIVNSGTSNLDKEFYYDNKDRKEKEDNLKKQAQEISELIPEVVVQQVHIPLKQVIQEVTEYTPGGVKKRFNKVLYVPDKPQEKEDRGDQKRRALEDAEIRKKKNEEEKKKEEEIMKQNRLKAKEKAKEQEKVRPKRFTQPITENTTFHEIERKQSNIRTVPLRNQTTLHDELDQPVRTKSSFSNKERNKTPVNLARVLSQDERRDTPKKVRFGKNEVQVFTIRQPPVDIRKSDKIGKAQGNWTEMTDKADCFYEDGDEHVYDIESSELTKILKYLPGSSTLSYTMVGDNKNGMIEITCSPSNTKVIISPYKDISLRQLTISLLNKIGTVSTKISDMVEFGDFDISFWFFDPFEIEKKILLTYNSSIKYTPFATPYKRIKYYGNDSSLAILGNKLVVKKEQLKVEDKIFIDKQTNMVEILDIKLESFFGENKDYTIGQFVDSLFEKILVFNFAYDNPYLEKAVRDVIKTEPFVIICYKDYICKKWIGLETIAKIGNMYKFACEKHKVG